MNDIVNRKYILVLAALAVFALAGGALLRPKKLTPQPPSPSELASLQSRVRREHLNETAEYLGERAEAMAAHVAYASDRASTCVAWRKDGQMLTTGGSAGSSSAPLSLITYPTSPLPPAARLAAPRTGQWVVVVARTADARLVWTPAVFGGAKQSICAGEPVRELIVNTQLGPAMSGAGVFDLEGALLGIVAACGSADNYHVISNDSVLPLLSAFGAAGKRIETTYGMRVEALNSESKRAISIEQGMLVTEVVEGGTANQSGLVPGDVITAVAGQPLSVVDELVSVMDSPNEATRTLEVIRRGRPVKIRMLGLEEARRAGAAERTAGIRIVRARPGAELEVAPESPAYRAGMRTGDRILQIGQRTNPTSIDLARAVAAAKGEPLWIVYQRDGVRKLALVTK